jgi:hypothetical protein
MLVDCEAGGFERGSVMALLAPVAPRSCGELAFMRVFVAIDALREFDFEDCFCTSAPVTRRALYRDVRQGEWEASLGVIEHRECRRAPALHCVATLAPSSIRPLCELAVVRIGFVTIGASVVRDWRFEIAALMTADTGDVGVFALQRKSRL